ncbi:glycoside hydrolase family 13 protein [Labilibaculum euxinus]|uniref:Alpha-amylase n=1 Tax=Labilibaculum euxinus TaxID=2686357 RepID=A0A7M4DA26_9BACT|nr:glycoside hydrolase family 13 protein [Labilibaculum euxinus]MUP39505.1 alpha-amylase [Labilibaculum euxinus]MVB08710.1 alpha-amylase [Labilibaculum euxinus]
MRTFLISLLMGSIFSLSSFAEKAKIERVEPMFWWVDMKNPNLQLLVHGENISKYDVSMNYPGVTIERMIKTDKPNYLFVNLLIKKGTKAGRFDLVFSERGKKKASYPYELKARKKDSANRKGYDASDVVYLIMPDRFANGDPKNDSVDGMEDKLDRENPDGRHGGDIQGIIDHLDYLQELGVTAIWNTPLMEDNEPTTSYHNYAISDYYKIDARYGSNEDYARLSAEAKKRGIKIIMDVVTNHCASAHWWMNDLPSGDWVHVFPEYTQSNHRKSTTNDPYVSKVDYEKNFDGWFARSMPDLNQKNDLLINYFIQNTIWWIEYADLGGIRVDTYPYNDKDAMAVYSGTIMKEYPNLNIVGETWLSSPAEIAYWQKDAVNHDAYNSNLPCVMDFSLFEAMTKAFNENEGWNTGLIRLYNSLAFDYLYPHTDNIFIFAENHDTGYIMSTLGGDIQKFKHVMTFLLTTRGIPQLYTGTEILLEGKKSDGDGKMRVDFPGGWESDAKNTFTAKGRTAKENEAFNFLKKLLNWRKQNPVIHTGKLMHYVPENDTYVYFRSNAEKTVMVVINKNENAQELNLKRFAESLGTFTSGKDVISEKEFDLTKGNISLAPNTSIILELK